MGLLLLFHLHWILMSLQPFFLGQLIGQWVLLLQYLTLILNLPEEQVSLSANVTTAMNPDKILTSFMGVKSEGLNLNYLEKQKPYFMIQASGLSEAAFLS